MTPSLEAGMTAEQIEEARWYQRRLMASQTLAGLKWLRTHGWDTLAMHDAIEDLEKCVARATERIGDA